MKSCECCTCQSNRDGPISSAGEGIFLGSRYFENWHGKENNKFIPQELLPYCVSPQWKLIGEGDLLDFGLSFDTLPVGRNHVYLILNFN